MLARKGGGAGIHFSCRLPGGSSAKVHMLQLSRWQAMHRLTYTLGMHAHRKSHGVLPSVQVSSSTDSQSHLYRCRWEPTCVPGPQSSFAEATGDLRHNLREALEV